MIDEKFVIDSLEKKFRKASNVFGEAIYEVIEKSSTNQGGVDLLLKNSRMGYKIFIEAKGEGSSKPTSPRYGLKFNSSQVFDCVATAAFRAMAFRSREDFGKTDISCIALPHSPAFRNWHGRIKNSLSGMQIVTLWVDKRGRVLHADGILQYNCCTVPIAEYYGLLDDMEVLSFPTNDSIRRQDQGFQVIVHKERFWEKNKIPSLANPIFLSTKKTRRKKTYQDNAAHMFMVDIDIHMMGSAYDAIMRYENIDRLLHFDN